MERFPRLVTSRMILRKIEIEDVPDLVRHANNKNISGRIINIPHPYREPDAVFRISYVVQGFKNKARYVFAMILKEPGEFIGEISLHLDQNKPNAQLGYWIGEPFWGKGLATEATAAVLKFGFEKLQLDFIFATAHVDNTASMKVLSKNGMIKNSVNGNVAQYGLHRAEYEAKQTF